MDNDIYVVSSLDRYRVYEMTVGYENASTWRMGNQVLIANKHARFLKACFDTYRSDYRADVWYHNGGELPGRILSNQSYLAHMEVWRFGEDVLTDRLYKTHWAGWRQLATYHLLVNQRHVLDKKNYARIIEFSEKSIMLLNTTYREMAIDVMQRIGGGGGLGWQRIRQRMFKKKKKKNTKKLSKKKKT